MYVCNTILNGYEAMTICVKKFNIGTPNIFTIIVLYMKVWFYKAVKLPKDADAMAKNVDLDQTALGAI